MNPSQCKTSVWIKPNQFLYSTSDSCGLNQFDWIIYEFYPTWVPIKIYWAAFRMIFVNCILFSHLKILYKMQRWTYTHKVSRLNKWWNSCTGMSFMLLFVKSLKQIIWYELLTNRTKESTKLVRWRECESQKIFRTQIYSL